MNIRIEEKSGFCYGVVRAIKMAEELLKNGEEVWCLGQIVHNEAEVKRLTDNGMRFIEHEELENLHNVKLLIRAHGEPPSTYETAVRNNLEIFDGTCPIVLRLQDKIRKVYEENKHEELDIIIFGKESHPEVIGLKGRTGKDTRIIRTPEEAMNIPLKQKVALFAQTTMDTTEYEQAATIIRKRLADNGGELILNRSICGHVSHRKPGLVRFSAENDVIVFMGGRKSSNAAVLYGICKSINTHSYFVSDVMDIKSEWFKKALSAGVCGATSTPYWQLEQAAEKIRTITGK